MPTRQLWKTLILPILICSLASLFYLYDFVLRVIPSVMSTQLMSQYQVTAEGLGFLSSFFFLGYTIMQIPCGLLFDRYGPRRLLTITCFVAAISAFLFLATDSFLVASLARLFMGMGSAFAYIGALVLAMRWLDKRFYAMSAGIIQLMGAIGAIIGQAALAFWLTADSAQTVMTTIALIGLMLATLFWFLIRDYPPEMKQELAKHSKIKISVRLLHVLNNRQNWFIALYAFSIWAPISIFAALWDVPFLTARDHLSATSAATMASGIWVGVALGGPTLGWLSAHLSSRRIPLLIGAGLGMIASLLIVYDQYLPRYQLEIMLILFGVAGSAQAVSFGVVQDNNSPRSAGTAAGFNNMAIVLGGALLQPLVGFMLRTHVPASATSIPPHYVTTDYRYALSVLPICFTLAFLCAWFLIRETKCKPSYNQRGQK